MILNINEGRETNSMNCRREEISVNTKDEKKTAGE
jgi:hypothetical protein